MHLYKHFEEIQIFIFVYSEIIVYVHTISWRTYMLWRKIISFSLRPSTQFPTIKLMLGIFFMYNAHRMKKNTRTAMCTFQDPKVILISDKFPKENCISPYL